MNDADRARLTKLRETLERNTAPGETPQKAMIYDTEKVRIERCGRVASPSSWRRTHG